MKITIEITPKIDDQGVPMCGLSACQWYSSKQGGKPICILDRAETFPARVCRRAWIKAKEETTPEINELGFWQMIRFWFKIHTEKPMKIEMAEEVKE